MDLLRPAAILTAILICLTASAEAQRRTAQMPARPAPSAARDPEIGKIATIVDESLSVLRPKPSLFSEPIQRMRLGRKVKILGVAEADGVRFFRVQALPSNAGWVQADAVFGAFRPGDDARMAKLIQAAGGFEQIALAKQFFQLFPDSGFRPAILLLYGDIIEVAADRLSRDAASRLNRQEMAASGAPMHSYYLNFNMLDRYRRLDIIFLFNPKTRKYHYDGASWKEIVAKHPGSAETAEALKRIDSIKLKLEAAGSQ